MLVSYFGKREGLHIFGQKWKQGGKSLGGAQNSTQHKQKCFMATPVFLCTKLFMATSVLFMHRIYVSEIKYTDENIIYLHTII